MLLAKDQWGNLVLASEYQYQTRRKIYCPGCSQKVIFKCGLEKIPHFAHCKNQDCQHFSEGETKEHLEGKQLLKKLLPADTQVEAYLPSLAQRPDLLWRNLAIEFQCSPLSRQRFTARTQNYLEHNYHPWWIVGRRFFPNKICSQLAKGCLQDSPVGPVLWGLDVKKGEILFFHSFDWHYQFGMSYEVKKGSAPLFGELFWLTQKVKTPASDWVWWQYQRILQMKLFRKEQSILQLQGLGYCHYINLLNLPQWCYGPSCHQFLLQEKILLLRGLFLKVRNFDDWFSLVLQIMDWPYLLVDQKQVLNDVFTECQRLYKRNQSGGTRKF